MKLSLRLSRVVTALFGWFAFASLAHAQVNLPRAQVGVNYSFQVSTTPAAPAGTLYTATGLPTGISINGSSGLISGTPTTAGTNQGTISLTSGGITNSFNVVLVVDPAAGTPAITSTLTATATAGQAFTYTVTADNSPTSFNVGALPAGLTFTSPTIAGTPTTAGTYSISLSANNAAGTGATRTLTLTVSPAGPVPAITSAATAQATLNAAFTYTITASNTPTSFSAIGLPFGLSLNTATGEITGTPTVAGVYTVTLSAANANGSGATTALTLTVGAVSTISSASSATLTVNQAGSFQLTATNFPLSFNVTGLPTGLSVNTTTGAITGTPTTLGTFTVTVSANNATGTGPASTLTLTVASAPPSGGGGTGGGDTGGGNTGGGSTGGGATAPVFTAHPTSQSATQGSTVTFTASVAGTGPFTYQWRRNGDAIFGATAATLTLTASDTVAGTYTLAVTNAGGTTVSNAATLTVTVLVTPPVITVQPASQRAGVGSSVTLSVTATGSALTYQWYKDGTAVGGATGATLVLPNVQSTATGTYSVAVANSAGTVSSVDAILAVLPTNAQIVNLSTRGRVGTGDKLMIAGFVVTGTAPKPVLIRAVGPKLADYGVTGVLADPTLEIYNSRHERIATNDNWHLATNAATIATTSERLGAFALGANSTDAVVLTTLEPGLYTAQVRGAGDTTGVSLVEIYDASESVTTSRLINVSSRGEVGVGGNVMIAGFVVVGPDSKRLLIRAAGPAMAGFGVTGTLPDPKLELYRGQVLHAENDDWSTGAHTTGIADAAKATGAFEFTAGSKDAGLLITLEPGSYSAIVSGVNGTTGAALVEVYEVP